MHIGTLIKVITINLILTTLLFLFSIRESFANDSTSHPTATGVEFIKNNNISIESETLLLKAKSVEVEYEFYNHSSKEVSVHMAFPLPEIHRENTWSDEPKTWNFHVYVNGKKYNNIKLQWRALVKDFDKAQLLNKLGISIVNPSLKTEEFIDRGNRFSMDCLNYKLSKEDQELLVSEGLISEREDGQCFVPEWNAQAIYLWEANFVPNKITKVKHTYSQDSGFAVDGVGEENSDDWSSWSQRLRIMQYGEEIRNATKKLSKVRYIIVSFYKYVIHTGGNWKGSIKKFKFIAEGPKDSYAWVDAPFPIKRISDTVLSAEINNYKPKSKTEYLEIQKKKQKDITIEKEEKDITFYYAEDASFYNYVPPEH
ncbi:MAG: hypothetical protein A2X59_10760 [Nitrospirae bacterium GWC2_42_7]|nr:MAG: hypothetical protein A2X59_10760 [Nitrospirae bacterium GWC2_42_7]